MLADGGRAGSVAGTWMATWGPVEFVEANGTRTILEWEGFLIDFNLSISKRYYVYM